MVELTDGNRRSRRWSNSLMVTGEAADGRTHRNFQGEVLITIVVKSAKITGNFTINMNKLANYCRRFHYIDRYKDLRICSICACGQLGDIWRSRQNFAEEYSSLLPSSFSGGFSCIHNISSTIRLFADDCLVYRVIRS